ncbi:O-antigen ligase family protein [Macrococcoides caseolyticum]|uniref:O-antigen ligase-related domain-containing protein n=1 Tax=Macrococcoides caseolyticum TaxID=69966 RepID=A0A855GRF2_9STAP|nr:O-antigen ligase family protein [Macrococcus caseolyticus]ARQ04109.1 O-Antigen ligase [Macrococcus caseolyticus]PKE12564.1 hypothetical protein CW685_03365 [Macrococcus caseolyticus]PKE26388.1 hypothetical protein CW686_05365 [Macrococcus caseolyticus]PKE48971.1 hypothetical protein CW677_02140 [Macrococcus caseolyticus]PKE58902.1 hypothetical protein CW673_05485 [Macrococcus caseolyticus]
MKNILFISLVSVQIFIILYLNINFITSWDISNLYLPYLLVVLIVSLIYQIFKMIKYRSIHIFLILTLLIYVLLYIYSYIYYDQLFDSIFYILSQSILFVLPCIILAININEELEASLIRFFSLTFYWVSITLFVFIEIPFLFNQQSIVDSTLLLNHQSISYLSAFYFGIGLYFLKEKKGFILSVIMIFNITNLHITFLAGGRGGAILVLIYIVYFLFEILKNQSIVYKFFVSIAIMICTISIIIFIKKDEIFERSFSYIDENGFNLEQTSGRDKLYFQSLELIKENLWFGQGMFNYYSKLNGTPHNLILEILLIGGIFLLLITLLCVFFVIIKYMNIYDSKTFDRFLAYLIIYPIVMLMFSGNFLFVGLLWFGVIYVLRRIVGYRSE